MTNLHISWLIAFIGLAINRDQCSRVILITVHGEVRVRNIDSAVTLNAINATFCSATSAVPKHKVTDA